MLAMSTQSGNPAVKKFERFIFVFYIICKMVIMQHVSPFVHKVSYHVNNFFVRSLKIAFMSNSDSADYVIIGADAGIIVRLFPHVRLSSMYFFEQYLALSSTTTESTGKGGSDSLSSGSKGNPYIQSSKVGELFPSHRANISIVYSLH